MALGAGAILVLALFAALIGQNQATQWSAIPAFLVDRSILSGIVVFGVSRFRTDATAAACKADIATVSVAADAYDAQTGAYPASVAVLVTAQYLKAAPASGTARVRNITPSATKASTRTLCASLRRRCSSQATARYSALTATAL